MGTASLFSGGTVSGDQSNPLIAEVEDSIEWYTGDSLFESVSDVSQAISSGLWIEASLGMAAIGAEAASPVNDPFGTLAGFGVGASAYRTRASETSDTLNAAATAASAAASAIEMAGAIVSAVRMTVRDIVAQTVGRLTVWAAIAGSTPPIPSAG